VDVVVVVDDYCCCFADKRLADREKLCCVGDSLQFSTVVLVAVFVLIPANNNATIISDAPLSF
jgi:hypothetical protein